MKKINFLILLMLASNSVFSQIKSYAINHTLIGPSSITFDLDSNGTDDFTFDIVTLSPGVLAATAYAIAPSTLLDNSTFGYPDTLNFGDPVTGYFHSGTGVLGTIAGGGQFNGRGIKYLGIRINASGADHNGWIKLNCSLNRDTLEIISVGFNTIATAPITAGQTSSVGVNEESLSSIHSIILYPNPASNLVTVNTDFEMNEATITIYNNYGQLVKTIEKNNGNTARFTLEGLEDGIYFLHLTSLHNTTKAKKVLVVKK